MKKLILLLIAAVPWLHAIPSYEEIQPETAGTLPMPVERKYFPYISFGVSGFSATPLPAPEVALGLRMLNQGHWAWDINGGATCFPPIYGSKDFGCLVFGQTSALYFPNPRAGVYIGAGLTAGAYFDKFLAFRHLNIPITVGYQFEKSRNFAQLQITTKSTFTLSYGISF